MLYNHLVNLLIINFLNDVWCSVISMVCWILQCYCSLYQSDLFLKTVTRNASSTSKCSSFLLLSDVFHNNLIVSNLLFFFSKWLSLLVPWCHYLLDFFIWFYIVMRWILFNVYRISESILLTSDLWVFLHEKRRK
jgi:hypothetical protein